MTYPHTMTLSDGRLLFVELPAAAKAPARRGDGLRLTPVGSRILDQLRAAAEDVPELPTAGRIKSLRHALGLTQQVLATKLGVTPLTVSRWERGQVSPNPQAVKKLRRLRRAAATRGVVLDQASAVAG
ncbi:MAG: helix-turn-helix domain-containing protein [Planctomycetota bacterium]